MRWSGSEAHSIGGLAASHRAAPSPNKPMLRDESMAALRNGRVFQGRADALNLPCKTLNFEHWFSLNQATMHHVASHTVLDHQRRQNRRQLITLSQYADR